MIVIKNYARILKAVSSAFSKKAEEQQISLKVTGKLIKFQTKQVPLKYQTQSISTV
jgi:hypothetical protein